MALVGASTIRDVIAFPKSTTVRLDFKSKLALIQHERPAERAAMILEMGIEILGLLQGQCLLVGAPGTVAAAQLEELGVRVISPPSSKDGSSDGAAQ